MLAGEYTKVSQEHTMVKNHNRLLMQQVAALKEKIADAVAKVDAKNAHLELDLQELREKHRDTMMELEEAHHQDLVNAKAAHALEMECAQAEHSLQLAAALKRADDADEAAAVLQSKCLKLMVENRNMTMHFADNMTTKRAKIED